ncbi:MAG TPA: hypothetical protein VKI65_06930 [Gemmataceae bacterium]|nr:hypothetical protein [Gemmataceae bacterium]
MSITVAAEHAAQITFQSYFRLCKKLAGMSGTAAAERAEAASSGMAPRG